MSSTNPFNPLVVRFNILMLSSGSAKMSSASKRLFSSVHTFSTLKPMLSR
uniref:Uncharacterized protein n=1 Tax=Anopheles christyi TaxID=43041 RepID=A0A182KJ21_9DIPT